MPQQLVDFQGRSVGSQPREGYLGRRRATLLFSAAGDFEKELDRLYLNSEKIKCPFFRRRAFEFLEAAKKTLLFLAARHKSLPGGLFEPPALLFPEVTSRAAGAAEAEKLRGLTAEGAAAVLARDWSGAREGDGKGYYITGRLTRAAYREDCLFDGPDPDMPVRGTRKYLLSAAGLFDARRSRADLRGPLRVLAADEAEEAKGQRRAAVVAYWRLEGVLNLPWHPQVKPWTGSTTYFLDADGLVAEHREAWDVSVVDAFLSTLLPGLGCQWGAPPAPPTQYAGPSFLPAADNDHAAGEGAPVDDDDGAEEGATVVASRRRI